MARLLKASESDVRQSLSDEPATTPLGPGFGSLALGGEYASLVTAKEKLLERAPHWTEEQAVLALRAAEGGEAIDEWGDLAELHEVSSAETMRRLADEEHAAGQKPW